MRDIRRIRATRQANYRGEHRTLPAMTTTRRGFQMRRKKLKRALASSSGLLALSIALPAAAQSPPAGTSKPEDLEEIVVTGLLGSLQRNLDMKRQAAGVVDVITSEDIGKFPDSNVAASLQRVPGVSIQRAGTRGEPEGITVRGFSVSPFLLAAAAWSISVKTIHPTPPLALTAFSKRSTVY